VEQEFVDADEQQGEERVRELVADVVTSAADATVAPAAAVAVDAEADAIDEQRVDDRLRLN
jgi:hypothetical protein